MAFQIYERIGDNTYLVREPGLTYSLDYNGKIDKLASVKQAIYCILMTERYSNPIYDDDYGVELEQYIGKSFGFVKATIENTLKEALTYDDRITDVIINSVEKSTRQNNACVIDFTVITTCGNVDETVEVNT